MSNDHLLFLKLGGSLITDKSALEVARRDVIANLSAELARLQRQKPHVHLIIGHGSGSFGHVAAARHHTHRGVRSREEWQGFCEVSASALRLNRVVRETLLESGVPVQSFQPSASAICNGGKLEKMALGPIRLALRAGLTPLVHGDVCFDQILGGTILSTEQILSYLAQDLAPRWLLLAGNTPGVLDAEGSTIAHINHANFDGVRDALGGSGAIDVTGGMASKVQDMLDLVQQMPDLCVRIFSGLEAGQLMEVMSDPRRDIGTLITA